MEVLLIGGPKDGMGLCVDDSQNSVYFPEMKNPFEGGAITKHEYRMEIVDEMDGEKIAIFIHTQSRCEAIARLMDAYEGVWK